MIVKVGPELPVSALEEESARVTFPKTRREAKPESTVVRARDLCIGGGRFGVIAGPCAVESRAQILEIAEQVKQAGDSQAAEALRAELQKHYAQTYHAKQLSEKTHDEPQ